MDPKNDNFQELPRKVFQKGTSYEYSFAFVTHTMDHKGLRNVEVSTIGAINNNIYLVCTMVFMTCMTDTLTFDDRN